MIILFYYVANKNPFIQDMHLLFQGPAIAFAKKGYHILLEKPMAVSIFLYNLVYNIKLHSIAYLQLKKGWVGLPLWNLLKKCTAGAFTKH